MNMGEGVGGRGRYSNMHTLSLKASFLLVKTSSFDYVIILSSNHTVGIRSLVWTCRDQTTWNVWLNETKHQAGCFRWRLSTDTVEVTYPYFGYLNLHLSQHPNNDIHRYLLCIRWKMFYLLYTNVAVLGRNRTLFHFTFRSHYHVRSALAQNFH